MATETLRPDAELSDVGLVANDHTNHNSDPDVSSTTVAATGNNVDTEWGGDFPTPTGNPTVGADLQEFRVGVEEFDSGQSGTPQARIELWENGSLVRAGSDTNVSAYTVLSFTWNANELATADGSLVQCKLIGSRSGGAPGARNTVNIGHMEWNADYTAGVTATRGQVSWAEVETPTTATRGQISFSELEVPLAPTRGQVSFGELEVPLLSTRGQVSWAEVETPITPTRGQVSWAEVEAPIAPTRGQVSFGELEVPDFGLSATRGQISFGELETPSVSTRGQISFGELETPIAPTRGLVSFGEFELPTTATRGQVSWAEVEAPITLTRGQVSFSELELPAIATRGLVSWIEIEAPDVGGGIKYNRCSISVGLGV